MLIPVADEHRDGRRCARATIADEADLRIVGWAMHVIDSSERSPDEVAHEIVAWCRRAVNGHAPAIRAVRAAEH